MSHPSTRDALDTAHRYLTQTESLLTVLSTEQCLEDVPPHIIGNCLWLASDQIERLGDAVDALTEQHETAIYERLLRLTPDQMAAVELMVEALETVPGCTGGRPS